MERSSGYFFWQGELEASLNNAPDGQVFVDIFPAQCGTIQSYGDLL
jgi:hypothetical protein